MSVDPLPVVDAWRAVAGRRVFRGRTGLAAMSRLAPMLAEARGECEYGIEFVRDPLAGDCVDLRVDAELPLQCQRTLERFGFGVRIAQRLGLLRSEDEEAALPAGVEPVLVPADGKLNLLELIEDELILAVPAIPVKPGSEPVALQLPPAERGQVQTETAASPFAVLAALKKRGP